MRDDALETQRTLAGLWTCTNATNFEQPGSMPVQDKPGGWGGGGLAGIAQWERLGLRIARSRVRFRSLVCAHDGVQAAWVILAECAACDERKCAVALNPVPDPHSNLQPQL